MRHTGCFLAAVMVFAGWLWAEPANWEQVAPFFQVPDPWAGKMGDYRSPLKFDDGRAVTNAQQWAQRRKEILAYWHGVMGPWPAIIEKPSIETLATERRENFQQHRVRVEIAPAQKAEGYLLVPEGPGPFPAVLVVYYEPETSIGTSKSTLRDYGYQLAKRGFVTLSIGSPGGDARKPVVGQAICQPLSYLGYVGANCFNALATLPQVDAKRIGVVGHSYGGKWAMFAACLYERFACGVWSDPGIVFDEAKPNVNYWEPWYLGLEVGTSRKPGVVTAANPRTGAYKRMMAEGRDLHELHALMAPRPFLVSGGSEDRPERWVALNHSIEVNKRLGYSNRVAMTNRAGHGPTEESNEQVYRFFEWALKR